MTLMADYITKPYFIKLCQLISKTNNIIMNTNKRQNTMNNQNDVYQAIPCKELPFFQTKFILVATNFLELFSIYNKVAWRSVTLKKIKYCTTIKKYLPESVQLSLKFSQEPNRGIKHAF
jgi:hypothetical protein